MNAAKLAGSVCLILAAMAGIAVADAPWVEVSAGMPPGPPGEDEGMFTAEASGTSTFDWLAGSEAHAYGTIAVSEAGVSKAWCQITGHDPYMGFGVSGSANTESFKPFVLTSATLPAGTAVTVHLDLSTAGTLEAREGFDGLSALAYAEFSLSVNRTQTGEYLVDQEGEAEVEGYVDEYETETFGAWDDLLTPLGDGLYSLGYSDTFTFTGYVGEAYSVHFELNTRVETSDGATIDTYNDTFAKCDFWNTGSYALTSPDDVDFEIIPEPATLALLGLAGLFLRARRTL